jgi:glycosyltransferase involved in cell wall biosynthesis
VIVGVCDYPSAYAFPPLGYGGIERWLWATAVGARKWGATVHLIGPQWRDEIPPEFGRHDVRLEDLRGGEVAAGELLDLKLDLLIVGHEYPSLPAWRRAWNELDCDVVTFQHDPDFRHPAGTFDGRSARLYCYSPEMVGRYREHAPGTDLSVQIGLDEDPQLPIGGRDLVWLGRICDVKAPHLAVRAAAMLGRRIRIVGPVHEPEYVRRHADTFMADHVDWVGELGGAPKAAAVREAEALVYTCSPRYVEAGAGVFGDALRAGTPVAALAWRPGTCAEVSLCERTGAVALVDCADGEEAAVAALAEAIDVAVSMKADEVQDIGLRRFDPVRHFAVLAGVG